MGQRVSPIGRRSDVGWLAMYGTEPKADANGTADSTSNANVIVYRSRLLVLACRRRRWQLREPVGSGLGRPVGVIPIAPSARERKVRSDGRAVQI